MFGKKKDAPAPANNGAAETEDFDDFSFYDKSTEVCDGTTATPETEPKTEAAPGDGDPTDATECAAAPRRAERPAGDLRNDEGALRALVAAALSGEKITL